MFPYPGLRPFRREEAHIFFGREEQTDQLLEKLTHSRFISVVGPSGCGKSSLVRAGMLAALETGYLSSAGARWQVVRMRPGNYPLRNLAKSLLVDLGAPSDDSSQPAKVESKARVDELSNFLTSQGPLGLIEFLHEHPLKPQSNLLLLVDQFEEIFRYHREGDSDEAEVFVQLLLTSAEQNEIPIYVVTTMRSDFIGNCALFPDLPEAMNKGQYLVSRLSREQQQMAIIGPARVFNGNLEARLVNRLLNEMGDDPDQLPLLQHCLMRMWLRLSERIEAQLESDGCCMTLEDYEAVGGLEDALSNHAEEAFQELDGRQQAIAETFFRFLSERSPNLQDIRRPMRVKHVAKAAGAPEEEIINIADVFRHPERCFITPAAGIALTADSTLDISHESLIRQWKRLKQWVEREAESAELYRHLEQTARLWKQGQAALWSTPDLENALAWKKRERPGALWAGRYGNHFELAMEFLSASTQAQEKQRLQDERVREEQRRQEEQARAEQLQQKDRERRRNRMLKTAVVGLLIALSLAGWAWRERDNAQKAQKETQQALQQAQQASELAQEEKNRAEQALAETEQQRLETEKALKEVETQKLLAEQAFEEAEQLRLETESALEEAEKQRLFAEEAKAAAEDAQKDAEMEAYLASERQKESQQKGESLKQIVNTSFGFIFNNSEGIEKFLTLIGKEQAINDLVPVLEILLDSSAITEEEQKVLWRQNRAKMSEENLKVLWKEECRSNDQEKNKLSYERLVTLAPEEQGNQWDKCYSGMSQVSQKRLLNGTLAEMNREEQLVLLARLGKEITSEVPVEPDQVPTQSTITIHTQPADREIEIGFGQRIALSVDIDEQDLQIHWSLDGPGSFSGDINSPTLSYVSPKVLDKETVEAVITLTVSDAQGETKATDHVTLTLYVPAFKELAIAQLLTIAYNCLDASYLTTPKAMNAFDICKIIVEGEPQNPQARKIMEEMAEHYKSWGDRKYESCLRYPENQRICKDAITLYERYFAVTDHIKEIFRFASVKDRREARKRLEKLEEMFE